MVSLTGEKLIFIVSQPRAGSTLLQRLLGSHPNIHTTSEPWLMLHPLYALRSEGHEAEYDAQLAWQATEDFLQLLPEGEDQYIKGVRRMYSYLYDRALADSGKSYFVDKTPRYYFVVAELRRVFPKARYVVLLRNPLAVLHSVETAWIRGSWRKLHKSKHDLISAPRLLLEGAKLLGERALVVHYERLVANPAGEMQRICEWLGVDFVPGMLEYGSHDSPGWGFGDQVNIYQTARPHRQSVDQWMRALDSPQVWRLANDYAVFLGEQTVNQMGYSYEKMQQILARHRPSRMRLRFTVPLIRLLERPANEADRRHQSMARLSTSLRRRGIRGTAATVLRRAIGAMSNHE